MTISINGISKTFSNDVIALDNVTLNIPSGAFGLLGPNGAGKTTLMRIISSILEPSQGSVEIDGIASSGELRAKLGYLPQELSFYPTFSVLQTVEYFSILKGLTLSKRQLLEHLDMVGLGEYSGRKVKTLSGGMNRRLGIAVALLGEPEILIVDEPTAGLDPEARISFRNFLAGLHNLRVLILSTHIVGDVEAVCSNIGILRSGRVAFSGTITELLNVMHGSVFLVEVPMEQLDDVKASYTVSAIKRIKNHVQARIIVEAEQKAPVGAELVQANVEDAYLFVTRGR